ARKNTNQSSARRLDADDTSAARSGVVIEIAGSNETRPSAPSSSRRASVDSGFPSGTARGFVAAIPVFRAPGRRAGFPSRVGLYAAGRERPLNLALGGVGDRQARQTRRN